MRERWARWSKVAKTIGYYSAGTIEFILDEDGFYYFMETIPHPVEQSVTEMVTGVDLIEWQPGQPWAKLQLKQKESLNGWAIECRVNRRIGRTASHQTGFIEKITFLMEIISVWRLGQGFLGGYSYFDSMIAKIIVNRRTDDCIDRV